MPTRPVVVVAVAVDAAAMFVMAIAAVGFMCVAFVVTLGDTQVTDHDDGVVYTEAELSPGKRRRLGGDSDDEPCTQPELKVVSGGRRTCISTAAWNS